jgi:hypothetical protein
VLQGRLPDAEGTDSLPEDAAVRGELRAVERRLAELEAAHAGFVERAAVREASLVADLASAQAQVDLMEQHQRRRYDDITETYHENYNSVGLVDARLDELSAEMVQRNLRRRRFIWNRLGWLLVDALAWIAWIILWVGTRVYRLAATGRR